MAGRSKKVAIEIDLGTTWKWWWCDEEEVSLHTTV
jgi:hypothetical protein